MSRLLHIALNLVIMGSIAGLSAAALMVAHWGLLGLLSGAPRLGTELIGAAAAFAIAATLMIRNRNDLADR